MVIAALRNPIQHYDWGSHTEIARLEGREPSAQPEAELWMGAYPSSPSLVRTGDEWSPLHEVLTTFVTSSTLERFGARLPFLTKYLAVERPLSIQVHPDDEAGRKGFDDGVFKDPFGKPELIVALGEMELLAGFRPEQDVANDLRHLGREDLASELEEKSTGELFTHLLRHPDDELLANIKEAIHLTRDHPWLAEMLIKHPHDIAAVAPLFLNHIHLHPHQGLYVPPGRVHCYLSGLGIEVMSASDNVIRAGLTSKAVDLDHFEESAELHSLVPEIIEPTLDGAWERWSTPTPEFALSYAKIEDVLTVAGLAIVAVKSGEVTCDSGLTLRQGDAAIIAEDSEVMFHGTGEIFRCGINHF